jgi:hypothetical protein
LIVLVLLALWLALPRLLGLAAERWLAVPGLQALRVDVESVGTGQGRLREVRADYLSAGGHRVRVALHDIVVDYSPASREIERIAIARGDIEIIAGPAAEPSPWPVLDWPALPLRAARIEDLHIAVQRQQGTPLEASGSFDLRQADGHLLAEFTTGEDVLRVSAQPPTPAGGRAEFDVEWRPARAEAAHAHLQVSRQPEEQPARLEARVPLSLLEPVARALGVALPFSEMRGYATVQSEAILGDTAGTLRAANGNVELVDVGARTVDTENPVALTLAGKLRFAWQPTQAELVMQPGWRWQASVGGTQPTQASGTLEHALTIRQNDAGVIGDGDLPFAVSASPWGQWRGTVQRFRMQGGREPATWTAAEAQLRIAGELKTWQRDALKVRDVRVESDAVLRWSKTAGLRSTVSAQLGVGALGWAGDSPLNVGPTTWTVNAEATAKADETFWRSLSVQGKASTPQLRLESGAGDGSKQTVSLGATQLQLAKFNPGGAQGIRGELQLAADALRFGQWPSPDVRARLRFAGDALQFDGSLRRQGETLLSFSGAHALAKACGEATLTARHALPALDKLLQPRPSALAPLAFHAGEADASFVVDWCARPQARFDLRGTLRARDTALGWEKARVDGLQTTLQLDGLFPPRGRVTLAAQRGELATGTQLTDLNVDLALAAQSLNVQAFDVNLLGGSLHAEPASVPWPLSDQALPLAIRQIDLQQLLALFNVQGLTGSGRMDGVLPLAYRDGSLEVDDGQLNSLSAGTLKYEPTLALPDNPGLLALRNFHYQRFVMRLWYAADGAYRTQATLEGSNPDFYDGYPIRFGLNINGELPGLFRSALFSGDFNRHILEQLQSGKLE